MNINVQFLRYHCSYGMNTWGVITGTAGLIYTQQGFQNLWSNKKSGGRGSWNCRKRRGADLISSRHQCKKSSSTVFNSSDKRCLRLSFFFIFYEPTELLQEKCLSIGISNCVCDKNIELLYKRFVQDQQLQSGDVGIQGNFKWAALK